MSDVSPEKQRELNPNPQKPGAVLFAKDLPRVAKFYEGARHLVAAAVIVALAIACGQDAPPPKSSHEVVGDRAHRIEAVLKILRVQPSALPGPILDAHFQEEKIGDDLFGPADYTSFLALAIPQADLGKWTASLVPLTDPTYYPAPEPPLSWWVSPAGFSRLVFYRPQRPLLLRANGWIAVSADSGQIFVFNFTT